MTMVLTGCDRWPEGTGVAELVLRRSRAFFLATRSGDAGAGPLYSKGSHGQVEAFKPFQESPGVVVPGESSGRSVAQKSAHRIRQRKAGLPTFRSKNSDQILSLQVVRQGGTTDPLCHGQSSTDTLKWRGIERWGYIGLYLRFYHTHAGDINLKVWYPILKIHAVLASNHNFPTLHLIFYTRL